KGGTAWGGSGGYGPSRFDNVESFASSYTTPGWQRAQARRGGSGGPDGGGQARRGFDEEQSPFSGRGDASGRGDFGFARNKKRARLTIEGELVAKSTGTVSEFNV